MSFLFSVSGEAVCGFRNSAQPGPQEVCEEGLRFHAHGGRSVCRSRCKTWQKTYSIYTQLPRFMWYTWLELMQFDTTHAQHIVIHSEECVIRFAYIWPVCGFVCVCAGESGMGKSTLVNSLFLTDLYKDRKLLNAEGESLYRLFSLCITHDERTALNNKGTLRSCLCVNQTTVSLRFSIIFVSRCPV